MQKPLTVYLAGEIHSDWREQIVLACSEAQLAIEFVGPELNHQLSDDVGEQILGPEESAFWKDHKSARINAIRNRRNLQAADVVIVRFGEKYKQWNAAFDAGFASALGKSVITMYEENYDHALKEINAYALATTRNVEQIVEILKFMLKP
jgi:YtoQ family protein